MTKYVVLLIMQCRPCLEREKERYANGGNGHVSRVKSYGKSSTTVLKEHLQTEHKIVVDGDRSDSTGKDETRSGTSGHFKQQRINFKHKLETFQPFTSQYELNRDISIWSSLDLEPFMFVEKQGMQYFFEKNFPNMTLPSRSTVSRSALYDVHDEDKNWYTNAEGRCCLHNVRRLD